jgi:hypothetical protein
VKVFLKSLFVLLPLMAGLLMTNSCHRELFTNKGAVSFSNDTLTFDTVFTTLGSVTRSFTVRNTQSRAITISDIKLMGGTGSQFRILIDGQNGPEVKNKVIPAHDSIYIFVEVTVQPNNANNPFVIYDDIQFVTNGITQNVVLEAMGQNAHYYFSFQVTQGHPFTFPTDKPNIIVNKNGGLPIFAVDTGATCTIPAGCKIFMGPGAVITVDGILNATATSWSDSTIIQYIRTDYPGQPGLWLGITYSRIATINMSHVIIDQSTFGISDEYVLDAIAQSQITTSNLTTYGSSQTPNVTLDKVIIRNTSSSAITAIQTNLKATNCLFYSCGGGLVQLGMGGTYNINNCTLANIYSSTITSQNQALTIFDKLYYLSNGSYPVGPFATTVNISNSIVGGNTSPNNGNDILFGLAQQSSDHVTFTNCFLTTTADSITAYQASNINNIDTLGDPQGGLILHPLLFVSPINGNYMPDSGSIVLGRVTSPASSSDLYDYTRSSPSSIGAIEWHH